MDALPASVLDRATVLQVFQVDEDTLKAVCETDGEIDLVCHVVLRLTQSELLANIAGSFLAPALRVLFILVLAYLAHRLLRRGIKMLVRRMKEQGLERLQTMRGRGGLLADTTPMDLQRASMRTETIGGVLQSIATVAIWSVAALTVLDVFGVNLGPLLAGAGIAGLAIGFGAQNLVRDFLSGMFMLLEDQYGIGDIVDTGEAAGVIEAFTLRTTRLRDVEGVVWYVPNGEIRRIGNKSQQWSRAVLDVGVAYHTDIGHASTVIKTVADGLWRDPVWGEFVLEEPEVWGVETFGANEIVIRLVVKTPPLQQFKVARELRARLKAAFDEAGIEIPFPQRTVWIRELPSGEGAQLTHAKQTGNRGDTGDT
jgi:moderate conductance mechanosensitive channel